MAVRAAKNIKSPAIHMCWLLWLPAIELSDDDFDMVGQWLAPTSPRKLGSRLRWSFMAQGAICSVASGLCITSEIRGCSFSRRPAFDCEFGQILEGKYWIEFPPFGRNQSSK